jgi:putative molybdopterin biosynthesis protein
MEQEQFLDVVDRDEAERRFRAVLDLRPLPSEEVPLADALNRVLAQDVIAPVDVPGFDRANVDGFALHAQDTFGASEEDPRALQLNAEIVATGMVPSQPIQSGTATAIATGGVVPRGADAVVMIEDTDTRDERLLVRRPATPGANITFAGTDIGRGETVLRRGNLLTSRETGVLAALGLARIGVFRSPRVAILSTGNEIVAPGSALRTGLVFDSNATVLADSVRELGGVPVPFGIIPDDSTALESSLHQALEYDVVLLSGGTSKGPGDLSYRVVANLGPPGIVAHGVALKPGKPLCLAAVRRGANTVPVVILPGFPTSAIFTFREFVAPIILALAGRQQDTADVVQARLPLRVNSERGRTEYLLVSLVAANEDRGSRIEDGGWRIEDRGSRTEDSGSKSGQRASSSSPPSILYSPSSILRWVAYPMGKGSGSVTTFSRADGFVTIPRQREYLEEGETVEVQLLSRHLRPADLVVIGSHCVGLDYLLGRLQERGYRSKFLAVGSMGGLAAAGRGECDLAGIHLLHPETNSYNRPYLNQDLVLLPGYGRLQGIVFRRGDARFERRSVADAVGRALADPDCVLINRNRGSGTRLLIDRLLSSAKPAGYLAEARSHNAVGAAVAQGRADWGVAIINVAHDHGLGFIPLQEEQYDFVVPRVRLTRPPVQCFRELLSEEQTRQALAAMDFRL